MKKIVILSSLIVLVGCAGNIEIADKVTQDKTAAMLPAFKSPNGQICICRAYNFNGGMQSFEIKANDDTIGKLSNDAYLCVDLMPGPYSINSSQFGFVVSKDITIESGHRKYMEFQVGFNGRNFITLTPAQGLSCINGTF